MHWIGNVIRRIDAAQRRYKPSAFVFAVIKKYGDDAGGRLVADLAHSAFITLFPLFLVLVTVLGLVASSDAAFRQHALDAVARQLPVIGRELERNVPELRRSSIIGLIIGLAGLVWGATGLADTAQYAMAQVWNLPGHARPGYFPRLGRSFAFLGLLGTGVCAATLLTALSIYGHRTAVIAVLLELLACAGNTAMYLVSFRVLTPGAVRGRQLLPGAVTGGVAWTLLLALGGYFTHRYVEGNSLYGAFATVLGLLAWISLSLQITVHAAEINVVLARQLWPRTIVQPPLTRADRAVLAAQALQNQRRDDEHVMVTFMDLPADVYAADPLPPA